METSSELIESSLIENGQKVKLHFIIHKPVGEGPFPAIIFNHGSTGRGTNPDDFKMHHEYKPIADFFVPKGWMVICPHRRGRGNSEGKYDEGLDKDGYSGDYKIALKGYERAAEDLSAAIEIIQTRADVDIHNMILGGQSRGGLLSIAYAGENPSLFRGVINVVGGWLGDGFSTALYVNGYLAKQGSNYPDQSLWLYAGQDVFYFLTHTKAVFQQFVDAGGNGEFIAFESADHGMLWTNAQWQKAVAEYMLSLGYQDFFK